MTFAYNIESLSMSNCYVYLCYICILNNWGEVWCPVVTLCTPCYFICDPVSFPLFVYLINRCYRNTKMSITMSKGSILQAFQVLIILINKRGGRAGLEKPGLLWKKPAQWGFFGGVFSLFWVFSVFIYICPKERVFRVFSVSRILLGASRL